jgi:hypothetical protein
MNVSHFRLPESLPKAQEFVSYLITFFSHLTLAYVQVRPLVYLRTLRCLLNNPTARSVKEGGQLRVGQRIEVLDTRSKWCEASVIDSSPDRVLVHYQVFIFLFVLDRIFCHLRLCF